MRNEDMYDTNSLMFEISELRKKNEKLEADKKALTEQLALCSVVSSAWYCKISTAKGQWFEIVTGKNEMEVAVKITEKFGKETVYNLIDRYELM